jgi:malonyl-CoA decarboxylase
MWTGLTGVGLGESLIKRAASVLAAEFPSLRTFATLSPIPTFAGWIDALVANRIATAPKAGEGAAEAKRPAGSSAVGRPPEVVLTAEEERALRALSPSAPSAWHALQHALKELRTAASAGSDATIDRLSAGLRPVMLRLATGYLTLQRRPSGSAADPVANFHLSNGVAIGQVSWAADRSERRMRESYGVMANYLYDISDAGAVLSARAERYSRDHVIAVHQPVWERWTTAQPEHSKLVATRFGVSAVDLHL